LFLPLPRCGCGQTRSIRVGAARRGPDIDESGQGRRTPLNWPAALPNWLADQQLR